MDEQEANRTRLGYDLPLLSRCFLLQCFAEVDYCHVNAHPLGLEMAHPTALDQQQA